MKFSPVREERLALAVIVVAFLIFFSFIGWGIHTEMERRVKLTEILVETRILLIKAEMRIRYECRRKYMKNSSLCKVPSEEKEQEPPE